MERASLIFMHNVGGPGNHVGSAVCKIESPVCHVGVQCIS